jgi:hypothetical protein
MFKKPAAASMTDAQWRLFWRLWNNACIAQGWTKANGWTSTMVDQKRHEILGGMGFRSLNAVGSRDGFDRVKRTLEQLAGKVEAAAEQAAQSVGRDMGSERRLRYVLATELLPGVAAYFGDPGLYVAAVIEDKFASDLGRAPRIDELTDEPVLVPRPTRFGETRIIEQDSRLLQLVMTLRERIRAEARTFGHDATEQAALVKSKYQARSAFFHFLAGCGQAHESVRTTQSVPRNTPEHHGPVGTANGGPSAVGARGGAEHAAPVVASAGTAIGPSRQDRGPYGDADPYAGSGEFKGD